MYVRRLKDELMKRYQLHNKQPKDPLLRVPLHGPKVTADEVLQQFFNSVAENEKHLQKKTIRASQLDTRSMLVHIDIPQGVS